MGGLSSVQVPQDQSFEPVGREFVTGGRCGAGCETAGVRDPAPSVGAVCCLGSRATFETGRAARARASLSSVRSMTT
jgi:hypothetical protein